VGELFKERLSGTGQKTAVTNTDYYYKWIVWSIWYNTMESV